MGVFLFLAEAWTAARSAFQVCFWGPFHGKIKSGSHSFLDLCAVPPSIQASPSPLQPLPPALPLHLSTGLSGLPAVLTTFQFLL